MSNTKESINATAVESDRRHFSFSLRWKLTVAFSGLFTIVFVFLALWVVRFSASTAQDRLEQQLTQHVEGGSLTIDGDAFEELIATVPAVSDPSNETGLGYPDSALFTKTAASLFNIRRTVNAGTYTWFKDPADGKLYTAASSGYFLKPQTGYTYKVPLADVAGPSTYALMEKGLSATVKEPAYTDAYGSWISAYTPIRNSAGESVGGIGQDYSLKYVNEVRSQAVRQVLPVLVLSFIVLVGLVLLLSTGIVRPIKRLTAVAARISDGEYNLDLSSMTQVRLRDELYTLTNAVRVMASKIAQREQSLKQEVTRLKVEIDEVRRTEAVKQITESEEFNDLAAKAAEMRRRMTEGRDK